MFFLGKYIVTFSIPDKDKDVRIALEEFKAKGGNISGLIVSLLKNYFYGNHNQEVVTKEILKIKELEEKYKKLIEEIEKSKKELEELKTKFEKEAEAQQIQEDLDLIRLLREKWFEDLLEKGSSLNHLLITKKYDELVDKIESRLSAFAAENKLSLPEAKRLFKKAFPELKELEL
ncbi:hypothetical protein DRP07_00635 [Archaeoglobales archaeon]|nr:MAG: hypothetical protein DRP07_00635 [Archaeoglobales archaeon]